MALGSASLNVILVYLYIFPLPLHIGRLRKGGCCWLCERCREFQEMLQTFLIRFSSAGYLSTFCLWFWQFHWLRFCAQTSAVCTVKKHLYYMSWSVLKPDASQQRVAVLFPLLSFQLMSQSIDALTWVHEQKGVDMGDIWVTGWFLRCSNTYILIQVHMRSP